MPSPIGEASYNGLGVPLLGDSVIRQENSSNAILTLMHTSANAGRFLMGMNYQADQASSVITDLARFDITTAGGFRVISGTTVLFELNSSGLYTGTTQLIAPGGGEIQQRITINTTASTLVSSNSGKVHTLSTQAATSNFIYLPTAGLARAGDWWDLVSDTTAVSLWNVSILGTSGIIYAHTGSTGVVSSTGAYDTTATTGAMWLRVICLSTVLPSYAITNMMTPSGLPTTNAYFSLGAGTTA